MNKQQESVVLKYGLQHVNQAFTDALRTRTAALMPYFTLGYPDPETSLQIVEAIAPFSDLIELGVPFSDPIADGTTIQRSTQQALSSGINTSRCLDMLRLLRSRGILVPLLLMGYYNPILAYGEERYPGDILEAGGDGLIVPDLPPEEAGPLRNEAKRVNLAYINFLAPSSSNARVKLVLNSAAGFVYMVSVTGVTGARRRFSDNLVDFVAKIKSMTELPIAVGFGISSPDQAAMISDIADGVIVGSALIDAVDAADDKPAAAAAFVSDLQRAVKR